MNIFVGNLSYTTEEDAIRTLFEQHGEVSSVNVIKDRETGRARGFGFVEMPNDEEARAAIAAIDGTELDGRTIKADQARERTERRGGGGGGGGRGPRRERW
jgi:RNA recognition motif-containing protein